MPVSFPKHFAPENARTSWNNPDCIRPVLIRRVVRVAIFPVKLVSSQIIPVGVMKAFSRIADRTIANLQKTRLLPPSSRHNVQRSAAGSKNVVRCRTADSNHDEIDQPIVGVKIRKISMLICGCLANDMIDHDMAAH